MTRKVEYENKVINASGYIGEYLRQNLGGKTLKKRES